MFLKGDPTVRLGDWVPLTTQKKSMPFRYYLKTHHESLGVMGDIVSSDALEIVRGLAGRTWINYPSSRGLRLERQGDYGVVPRL